MTTTQIILTVIAVWTIASFAVACLFCRHIANCAEDMGYQKPRHEQAQRPWGIRKGGDVETFIHGECK